MLFTQGAPAGAEYQTCSRRRRLSSSARSQCLLNSCGAARVLIALILSWLGMRSICTSSDRRISSLRPTILRASCVPLFLFPQIISLLSYHFSSSLVGSRRLFGLCGVLRARRTGCCPRRRRRMQAAATQRVPRCGCKGPSVFPCCQCGRYAPCSGRGGRVRRVP